MQGLGCRVQVLTIMQGAAGGWVQAIKAGESDATRKAGFVMVQGAAVAQC